MQVTAGYIKSAYYGGGATYGNTANPYENRLASKAAANAGNTAAGNYPQDTVTLSAVGLALYAAQAQSGAPGQNSSQPPADVNQLTLAPATVTDNTLRDIASNIDNHYSADQQSTAAHELRRREDAQGAAVSAVDTLS